MCKFGTFLFNLIALVSISDGARILAVFPAPYISHQTVFRPLTQELARRGHEVVIITTDPAFKDPPTNITEIDIHKVSYEFKNKFSVKVTGNGEEFYEQIDKFYDFFAELFEVQINTVEVRNLINDTDQHFDLLLIEECVKPALVFSHIYKAPVVTISSLGSVTMFSKYLKETSDSTRFYKQFYVWKIWEKAKEIYKDYLFEKFVREKEANDNRILRKNFGQDIPALRELKKNVAVVMVNLHSVWEENRPKPSNVVYLGGLHLEMDYKKELSTELKTYLDSSVHGVVYMSLGSLVVPSKLPVKNMRMIFRAFSKLPYDFLVKWDEESIPDCPCNVKLVNWVPQRKLLQHPNIKLFITQGGIQSTDEAIVSGVPVIGIPCLGDQWYNVEKYVHFKIGLRIDYDRLTEEKIMNAIKTVIEDGSYRQNIKALNSLVNDQPETSLQRAVFWTEYTLRHGVVPHHHKAVSAHLLSFWEELELGLIITAVVYAMIFFFGTLFLTLKVFNIYAVSYLKKFKVKVN